MPSRSSPLMTTAALQPLLTLCQQMTAQREVPALLELIAREAARLMAADRVSILLLDRERQELWSQVTLDGQLIRFDARLGIAGACVMTGDVLNIPDAQQDPRFYSQVDAQTQYRTGSVLAVPLRAATGDIIGTMQALNKRNGTFTDTDEQIAVTLAAQAALAIETATLIEDLKHRQDRLRTENTHLWREVEGRSFTQRIIGTSPPIQTIVRLIDQIRDTSVNVLITGESGTGKELVAKAIHYNSPRARGPLVSLNCAAIPEHLIESELFGIEKGVATGVDRRIGKFEEAHGGTLFLDEIGELSLAAQVKMLRVLQERVLVRVGGRSQIPLDVRILAATNVDLDRAVREGRFRSDLHFRLKVIPIHMPSLREIPEDLPLFAEFFLDRYCAEMGKDRKRLTAGALRCLEAYHWPGNVRELENEIKRLVVTVRRQSITEEDLSEPIRLKGAAPRFTALHPGTSLKQAVAELEKQLISEALQRCESNHAHTAKTLGISRQGLLKKLKRYRIP